MKQQINMLTDCSHQYSFNLSSADRNEEGIFPDVHCLTSGRTIHKVTPILKAKFIFIIFAGILSYGCISTPKHASLIDVPFRPQEQTNHCGVVSLAMALDYYNVEYNLTNLIDEAFIPVLNGSSLELMADTANKYGLNTRIDSISVNSLQSIISAKQIPIIYMSPINNSSIGHFAIITGISSSGKKLRIHETNQPNHWVRTSNLMKHSIAGNFPALIISKPSAKQTK